jgi:hypothetical protein
MVLLRLAGWPGGKSVAKIALSVILDADTSKTLILTSN